MADACEHNTALKRHPRRAPDDALGLRDYETRDDERGGSPTAAGACFAGRGDGDVRYVHIADESLGFFRVGGPGALTCPLALMVSISSLSNPTSSASVRVRSSRRPSS